MCVLAAHTDSIFKGKLSKAHDWVPGAYNHICKSIRVQEDLASSDWVNHLGEADGRCDLRYAASHHAYANAAALRYRSFNVV